ncbi:MAG: alpha-amylase family glycosyl hydrolase [Candidatus Lernaella stagnicola]|nr:alpha-amylase family glycosyl hydrolase [Candidatus Lernaella stagnicola]
MMRRLLLFALPPLLTLALVALFVGCVDLTPITDQWDIGTHVGDWRDEVIYQLMVDRFDDGDKTNNYNVNAHAPAAYHGGDWQGVIDKLNYLDELGVTAIWISPVVNNVEQDAGVAGYHGYWTQSFIDVNPHFGDLAKLREMVDACHDRGIKVILDIVTNHIGQLFFYDINGNGRPDESVYGSGTNSMVTRVSEYDPDYDERGVQASTSLGEAGPAPMIWLYDPAINRVPPQPAEFQNPNWYNRMGRVWDWNNRDQVVLGDFPGGLKDIKTTNPAVREKMIEVFSYWIGAADFDGFRIDTLKHIEHGFWQTFCPGIRRFAARHGKRNFFMFGEAFDGDDALIGGYTFNNAIDSVFYFSHKFTVIDGVFKYGGPTSEIENLFNARATNYSSVPNELGPTDEDGKGIAPQKLLVNFIDNHDLSRYLYDNPNLGMLHNVLIYMFTIDGIPCLYYGTEQQFDGGNDPFNREDLWTSGFGTSNETFQIIKHLIKLRKKYLPLRRGDMQIRWSSERTGSELDAGIFAFEREYKGETVLVVVNTNDEHASVTSAAWMEGQEGNDMQTSFPQGTVLVNVFDDQDVTDDEVIVGEDGKLAVTVQPRGGKIYVRAN